MMAIIPKSLRPPSDYPSQLDNPRIIVQPQTVDTPQSIPQQPTPQGYSEADINNAYEQALRHFNKGMGGFYVRFQENSSNPLTKLKVQIIKELLRQQRSGNISPIDSKLRSEQYQEAIKQKVGLLEKAQALGISPIGKTLSQLGDEVARTTTADMNFKISPVQGPTQPQIDEGTFRASGFSILKPLEQKEVYRPEIMLYQKSTGASAKARSPTYEEAQAIESAYQRGSADSVRSFFGIEPTTDTMTIYRGGKEVTFTNKLKRMPSELQDVTSQYESDIRISPIQAQGVSLFRRGEERLTPSYITNKDEPVYLPTSNDVRNFQFLLNQGNSKEVRKFLREQQAKLKMDFSRLDELDTKRTALGLSPFEEDEYDKLTNRIRLGQQGTLSQLTFTATEQNQDTLSFFGGNFNKGKTLRRSLIAGTSMYEAEKNVLGFQILGAGIGLGLARSPIASTIFSGLTKGTKTISPLTSLSFGLSSGLGEYKRNKNVGDAISSAFGGSAGFMLGSYSKETVELGGRISKGLIRKEQQLLNKLDELLGEPLIKGKGGRLVNQNYYSYEQQYEDEILRIMIKYKISREEAQRLLYNTIVEKRFGILDKKLQNAKNDGEKFEAIKEALLSIKNNSNLTPEQKQELYIRIKNIMADELNLGYAQPVDNPRVTNLIKEAEKKKTIKTAGELLFGIPSVYAGTGTYETTDLYPRVNNRENTIFGGLDVQSVGNLGSTQESNLDTNVIFGDRPRINNRFIPRATDKPDSSLFNGFIPRTPQRDKQEEKQDNTIISLPRTDSTNKNEQRTNQNRIIGFIPLPNQKFTPRQTQSPTTIFNNPQKPRDDRRPRPRSPSPNPIGFGFEFPDIKLRGKKEPKYQGFIPSVFIRGKPQALSDKPLTRSSALALGSRFVDVTPSARFTLNDVFSNKKPVRIAGEGYFEGNRSKFRDYRVRKGVRIPQQETFIEFSRYRMDKERPYFNSSVGPKTKRRGTVGRTPSLYSRVVKSPLGNGYSFTARNKNKARLF